MTSRPAYWLMNVEFDAFLCAAVGDERNGMRLTVLSALTRLDCDPWEKAAELANLTSKDAIATLTSLIARLPLGQWDLKDVSAIATRLVMLLPPQRSFPGPGNGPGAAKQRRSPGGKRFQPVAWLICLTLLSGGLFLLMRSAGNPSAAPPYAVVLPPSDP